MELLRADIWLVRFHVIAFLIFRLRFAKNAASALTEEKIANDNGKSFGIPVSQKKCRWLRPLGRFSWLRQRGGPGLLLLRRGNRRGNRADNDDEPNADLE